MQSARTLLTLGGKEYGNAIGICIMLLDRILTGRLGVLGHDTSHYE